MHRVKADIPIVADAADGARALTEAVKPRSDAARAAAIAQAKKDAWASLQAVQPQMGYLEVIRELLPENGILCDEMTQVGYVSWFGFPFHAPRTLITSGFSGTLGAGLPDGSGGEGRAAEPAGGGGDRRWRLSVRRLGPGDGGAIRDQSCNNSFQQRVLWQRAARSAAVVRGPRVRLGAEQSGFPDLCQGVWASVVAGHRLPAGSATSPRRADQEALAANRADADRGDDRHHQGILAVGVHSCIPGHAGAVSEPVHPVDEILPLPRLFALGLQHVLVMYANAVAVPLIIGGALHMPKDQIALLINADLFACGIATLVQTVGVGWFGIRLPVIMGVTAVSISPMLAMAAMPGVGLTGIYGAVLVGGMFGLLVVPFVHKVLRFFPSVVTGSIITMIGVSLMRVGIGWAGGGAAAADFGAGGYLGRRRHGADDHSAGDQIRPGIFGQYVGADRHRRRLRR
jgi:hypothetical protein